MLAQVLEQAGHAALSLPIAHASLVEMLGVLEIRQDDVICISALPPYAFPPARTMCKLIRERFPKVKLVIGVWGFSGDTEKAKARFERTQPDRLLTSLAQAVEQIQELIRDEFARLPRAAPDAALLWRDLGCSGSSNGHRRDSLPSSENCH
jgi:hypothetical protein